MTELLAKPLLGFLPVVLFLLCLIYLDSYKLVRMRSVLIAIAAGIAAAGVSYLVSLSLLSRVDTTLYSRYVAPVVEELLKAIVLIVYIRARRVGFLVDGAILGFAIGTGFAVIENAYYLKVLPDAKPVIWVIRGFGTAIMHGGTTAIFGMLSKLLTERRASRGFALFVPGLLAAIVLHSFFNHFFLRPVVSTILIVLCLPPLIVLVFRRSESSLQDWLGVGFDADTELLGLIHSGEFSESRIGRYLRSLRDRFRGEVVVDMLCYLRLHVELSLRAKGELMMREAGFRSPIEPEIRAKFDEMKFLERSIGRTGRLAMMPFLHVSDKDLWQLYMLGKK